MHNTLISGDFIIMELKYHAYIKETLLSLFSDQFSRCLPLMPYREPKLIDGFSGVSKFCGNITLPGFFLSRIRVCILLD